MPSTLERAPAVNLRVGILAKLLKAIKEHGILLKQGSGIRLHGFLFPLIHRKTLAKSIHLPNVSDLTLAGLF